MRLHESELQTVAKAIELMAVSVKGQEQAESPFHVKNLKALGIDAGPRGQSFVPAFLKRQYGAKATEIFEMIKRVNDGEDAAEVIRSIAEIVPIKGIRKVAEDVKEVVQDIKAGELGEALLDAGKTVEDMVDILNSDRSPEAPAEETTPAKNETDTTKSAKRK